MISKPNKSKLDPAFTQRVTREDRASPSTAEQLSYVGGEFASTFAWNMVAGYLLFYYTDVAFLPVAALGTLMLLSRVLDAVIDPVVGILVDRTKTRWGQARPYLLFASVPFGILCVLTFAVPDWSPDAKVRYAYATFVLLGICYSLLYIPYGALQPMMVRDSRVKVRIGSWRAAATSVASIVVYSFVLPVSNAFGENDRKLGFAVAALLAASVTVGLYFVVFLNCKERFTRTLPSSHLSIKEDLSRLIRNPVWIFVVAYAFLNFIRLGLLVSLSAYLTKTVLHNPQLLAILLPLVSISMLAGGLLAGPLIRRFGLVWTNVAFLSVSIVAHLCMSHLEGFPGLFIGAFMIANVVGGIVGATVFIGCTDAVEYSESRFGERSEGLVFSSVSFGMKVGMAIGAAGTAYALSWAGYNPLSSNEQAVPMIRTLYYYVPDRDLGPPDSECYMAKSHPFRNRSSSCGPVEGVPLTTNGAVRERQ